MRTGAPRKRDSVLAPDFGFGVAPCLYDPGGKVMGRMSAVMDRAAAVIGILALAIAAGTHAQDARAQAPRSGGAITLLYAGDGEHGNCAAASAASRSAPRTAR